MFPGYQFMDQSWMGWMIGGSVLFWLVIVGLVVFATARFAPRERGGDALAILDRRLARGEIDVDEYRTRRGLIVGSPSSRTTNFAGGSQ